MTDREWLQQYNEGPAEKSGAAMCEIIRRHSAMVYATALREVRDAHLADDITQAVFLVLMRRAKHLGASVVLGGWLFKTTMYAAADARKMSARRARHEREAVPMQAENDPAATVQTAEVMTHLNAAVAQLSAADRNAVILRFLQGQSTAQVALALGTNEITARQRVSRALERLRKLLAGKGVLIAAVALADLFHGFGAHAAPAALAPQLEAVTVGGATPTAASESLAQGVLQMFRNSRLKRGVAVCAVLAAVILAVGVPFALSQAAAKMPEKAPVMSAAGAGPVAPVVPLAQLTQNTVPVAAPATAATEAAAPVDPEAVRATVAANTAFASDIYQALVKDGANRNVFISPYSISTILGLAAVGARGKTSDEMNKVLHITNMATINAGIYGLTRDLVDTENGARPYQLSVANSLWDSERDPMTPNFLDVAKKYYGTSGVYMLDFRADPEAARQKINQWVEDHTQTKIKELLPQNPPSITKDTGLVLANAIYFKGSWQSEFQPNRTMTETFHGAGGKDAPTSLMRNGGGWQYFEDDEVQIVSLPYKAARTAGTQPMSTSMLVILPRKVDGLAAVEKKMSAETLTQWMTGLKYRVGQVLLPKFTITCPTKLNDTLKEMGMVDAFDVNKADLKGIATPPPGYNLYISGVYHKAFVDVNEEGTEAAAATAVVGGLGGGGPPKDPFTFRADHPFLFLIRYDPTNSILFMGHLAEPTPPSPSPAATAPARGPGRARGPGAGIVPLKDPKAAATAALDLTKNMLKDTAFVDMNNHRVIFNNLNTLERAAQTVADDDGKDAATAATKSTTLGNALNTAIVNSNNVANRATETPEDMAKARDLAAKLREIAAK